MENYSLRDLKTQTNSDQNYKKLVSEHFNNSAGTVLDKMQNFSRFVPRQALSIFLAKHEIFKKILNIHGNIVECGVFMGGGVFTWAQLSSIYEPYNHNRRIFGFDTFSGFEKIDNQDKTDKTEEEIKHKIQGGYSFNELNELQECSEIFDINRPIGHIPKIEFIKGDANLTIPEFINKNKHMVVSLLYLDFDLYEPTKTALEHFLPRMPKGSVIAFDELNQKQWPGETMAVLESIGIRKIKLERFNFTPAISFAILE